MPGANFLPGEPAPWFEARSPRNERFVFDSVGGRYVVLCFFGSAAEPGSRRVLDDVYQREDKFEGGDVCFFGVSIDSDDERKERVREKPGIRFFWDVDRKVSRMYGAALSADGQAVSYRRFSLVLDERLRVLAVVPFGADVTGHVPQLLEILATLPPLGETREGETPAPVLIVPRIFEPELCQSLMRYYEGLGGADSGYMVNKDGQTVAVTNYSHKRRRDQEIRDDSLRAACVERLHDRLVPEIQKAFQFNATRIERYIVACYDAETGGYFRPHRDNTTKGTAHRRFAVSLVLNTGEFEGGHVRFPEFGRQTYSPPAGGAVVFSCSLLHEATPVIAGKRYVFLPFLYDEAAAQIRRQNEHLVVGNVPAQSGA